MPILSINQRTMTLAFKFYDYKEIYNQKEINYYILLNHWFNNSDFTSDCKYLSNAIRKIVVKLLLGFLYIPRDKIYIFIFYYYYGSMKKGKKHDVERTKVLVNWGSSPRLAAFKWCLWVLVVYYIIINTKM